MSLEASWLNSNKENDAVKSRSRMLADALNVALVEINNDVMCLSVITICNFFAASILHVFAERLKAIHLF